MILMQGSHFFRPKHSSTPKSLRRECCQSLPYILYARIAAFLKLIEAAHMLRFPTKSAKMMAYDGLNFHLASLPRCTRSLDATRLQRRSPCTKSLPGASRLKLRHLGDMEIESIQWHRISQAVTHVWIPCEKGWRWAENSCGNQE